MGAVESLDRPLQTEARGPDSLRRSRSESAQRPVFWDNAESVACLGYTAKFMPGAVPTEITLPLQGADYGLSCHSRVESSAMAPEMRLTSSRAMVNEAVAAGEGTL